MIERRYYILHIQIYILWIVSDDYMFSSFICFRQCWNFLDDTIYPICKYLSFEVIPVIFVLASAEGSETILVMEMSPLHKCWGRKRCYAIRSSVTPVELNTLTREVGFQLYDEAMTWNPFPHHCPLVRIITTSGFPTKKANGVERWWFLCYHHMVLNNQSHLFEMSHITPVSTVSMVILLDTSWQIVKYVNSGAL